MSKVPKPPPHKHAQAPVGATGSALERIFLGIFTGTSDWLRNPDQLRWSPSLRRPLTHQSELRTVAASLVSSQPVACVRHIGSGGPLKPEGQGGSR
jgi:hypothetical protein